MPKQGFLTPKAIANRIKAKGLQKLKWYCQMCQKQCRDENGFKCHTMSDSHRRQMEVFALNPGRLMHDFSSTFEKDFLSLLSHTRGTKRTHANTVYQEFVKDRDHQHMNSTIWTTLSGFVRHLGRTGKCIVDYQEEGGLPGWYIQWIERDPLKDQKAEAAKKREIAEALAEERHKKLLEKQRFIASESEHVEETNHADRELKRDDKQSTIGIAMSSKPTTSRSKGKEAVSLFDDDSTMQGESSRGEKRKLSALESIMMDDKEDKKQRSDMWLHRHIVVKVVHKKLADGKYYKKKGVVEKVIDGYTAVVRMNDSDDVLKIDQSQLETVIPNVGYRVLIVNTKYRGETAKVKEIDMARFRVTLEIDHGPRRGRTVSCEYEDFSKLSPQSWNPKPS